MLIQVRFCHCGVRGKNTLLKDAAFKERWLIAWPSVSVLLFHELVCFYTRPSLNVNLHQY